METIAHIAPLLPTLDQNEMNPRKSQVKPFVDTLIASGPALIANLEKAFPNATFAFVGRDSQLIGDLVEAFYLSIGQKGRVARVGMSKPTLADPSFNDEDLLEYLGTLGLDIHEIEQRNPFIFIDTISQGYGRQARYLTSTVYDAHHQMTGRPVGSLLRKVNIVGLVVSTFNGERNDLHTLPQLFAREEQRYLSGQVEDLFEGHKIPTFPETIPLCNESGYEHYTYAWHGTFGPFSRDAHGKIVPTPGPASPDQIKMIILAAQRQIHGAVNTAGFRHAVMATAQGLGYEFPQTRGEPAAVAMPAPMSELPEEMRALIEEGREVQKVIDTQPFAESQDLRTLVRSFQKPTDKGESPTEMTENGKTLYNWYRTRLGTVPDHVLAFQMFKALRMGRKGLRLRSEDIRVIAADIFAHTRPSPSLLREAQAFADEAKAFRDMLSFEDWIKDRAGYQTYLDLKRLMDFSGDGCGQAIVAN